MFNNENSLSVSELWCVRQWYHDSDRVWLLVSLVLSNPLDFCTGFRVLLAFKGAVSSYLHVCWPKPRKRRKVFNLLLRKKKKTIMIASADWDMHFTVQRFGILLHFRFRLTPRAQASRSCLLIDSHYKSGLRTVVSSPWKFPVKSSTLTCCERLGISGYHYCAFIFVRFDLDISSSRRILFQQCHHLQRVRPISGVNNRLTCDI